MPSSSAARNLLPPVKRSVARMCWRSASASEHGNSQLHELATTGRGPSEVTTSTCTGEAGEEIKGVGVNCVKSSGNKRPPAFNVTARSTAFSNSRTLPGQASELSQAIVSGGAETCLFNFLLLR